MDIDNIKALFNKKASKLNLEYNQKLLLKKLKQIIFKDENIEIVNNLIVIDYNILIKLSKTKEFQKYSTFANSLLKILKSKRIIHPKSKIYPKNLKIFSANPIQPILFNLNLQEVDKILDIKRNLENNLMDIENLYVYLRLFTNFSLETIFKFNLQNYIVLDDKLSIFIIENKLNQELSSIKVELITNKVKEFFDSLYHNNQQLSNLLDYITIIFSNKKDYEAILTKFLKQYNISILQVKKAVDFEYLINNTSLKLTLKNYTLSPKITLKELDYMFKTKIPQTFLDKEQKMFDNYFENEELDEIDLDKYLTFDVEVYEKLKQIKKEKFSKKFFLKWEKFIDSNLGKSEVIDIILSYVLYLLNKSNPQNKKHIKFKTLQDYLYVLFNYVFNIIIYYNKVDEYIIAEIKENIFSNKNLTIKSQKKYWRIAKKFLKQTTNFDSNEKIELAVDVRRSYVFKDEFKQFIQKVYEDDKRFDGHSKLIKQKIRSVFLILLYHSGARKNELRSRLLKDLSRVDNNKFILYVDLEGIRNIRKLEDNKQFSLKNKNAKRQIVFTIKDPFFLGIINKYLNFLEKHQYKFLFPKISDKGILLKKHVAKEEFFNDLSIELQKFTNRYTPLHSLRHSFATNFLLENLNQDDPKIIFKLSTIMGHADPDVTLRNYIHKDYLYIENLI